MDNNILLELRQKNADVVYNSGSYTSNLSRGIVISDGDQLAITKCFIDTQAQTDEKIIIEDKYESIDLEIDCFLYHTNSFETTDKVFSEATSNDGFDYISSTFTAQGAIPAGYVCITGIRVDYNGKGTENGEKWGDLTGIEPVRLYYINVNGVGTTSLIEIPEQQVQLHDPESLHQTIQTNILAKVDSVFADPTDKRWSKQRTVFHSIVSTTAPLSGVLTPRVYKHTINIKSGAYMPDDICRIVNNDMTTNSIANGQHNEESILNNTFFHLSTDYHTNKDYFTKSDGTMWFFWKSVGYVHKYFVGASAMELAYDPDASLFFWKYAHQPIFGAGGTILSTIVQDTTTNLFYSCGKNGGVGFAALSAKSRSTNPTFDDKPYDFWEEKLGFDVNRLLSHYIVSATPKNIGGGLFHMPEFQVWGNGFNVISARPNTDSLITKATPRFLAAVDQIQSTNDLTTELYGLTPVCNQIVLEYGYFMIEVSASFYNEMIGQDITTNIMGIVNRFYSIGAYTTQDGSNIIYQHKGKDLYINSIKIRILDSDKNEVESLGDDNTVFLSLIKNSQPQIKQPIKQ